MLGSECLCAPKLLCQNANAEVTVLGAGAFGGDYGVNGISDLIKETPES